MAAPTREEYEKALQSRAYLEDVVIRENRMREDLINKLCGSQKCLQGYKESLKSVNELIQKYEIYQELLAEYNR